MLRLPFLLLLLLAAATVLPAQATIGVAPLEPVYRDIDVLVAHGLISTAFVGQRPYSRREIGRLVMEAASRLERVDAVTFLGRTDSARSATSSSPMVATLVRALRAEYADEIRRLTDSASRGARWGGNLLNAATLDFTRETGSGRSIPYDNGIGSINGFINPLLSSRLGRVFKEGDNLQLETTHLVESPHLALGVTPHFALSDSAHSSASA